MAVRRESVRLELQDAGFSTGMAKNAAATALLSKELHRLDGTSVSTQKSLPGVTRETDALGQSTRRTSADINQFSGRLSILLRGVGALGPAVAPVGAVATAGIAGLASQFGFAATGALSLMVAAQGLGDALKAVEAAKLDPTAANIEKAEQAMAKLAPEARQFVDKFQEIRPVLGDLQRSAAAGWFPGLTDALGSLETAAPRLERILTAVSSAGGDAVAAGARSLAGSRWSDFFDFIEAEAPRAISDLSRAVGSLAHGFAELWIAFDPVNDGVRDWLVDIAKSFDDWATGLDETEGFKDFISYVQENGPKVADAAMAIGNALLQIAEAAAPMGGPVLEAITGVANAIALIADSPLGGPIMAAVTAMSALSLATRGLDVALSSARTSIDAMGSGASGLNRMAATLITISGSASLIQTAFENIAGIRINSGTLSRDLEALANGKITKNFDDLYHTFQDIDHLGLAKANPISWISSWDPTGAEAAQKNIKDIDNALAGMVESGNAEMAASAWEELQGIGKAAGKSTEELTKLFPEYATALDNASASTSAIVTSTDALATSQDLATARMKAARDAARESGKAFIDFSDSIAGEKFSLSSWLKGFEDQVRALANFRDNIQNLRDRGLNDSVIDNLIAQGPAAAQAVEGLANAGEGAIKRLNRAAREGRDEIRGMGRDAKNAEGDVSNLGNAKAVPTVDLNPAGFEAKRRDINGSLIALGHQTAFPKVDVNIGDSLTQVNRIQSAINALRGKTLTIDIVRRTQGMGKMADAADARGSASGSTVPKDGGPYSDRFPYMLAPGEEVISNRHGQADRHRPLLKMINAGMLAEGGTAGRKDKGSILITPGVGALAELDQLPKSLKSLIKWVDASSDALKSELSARQSLADSLSSAVSGKLTSDLFGSTDVWSMGGTFEDVMARLNGDIASGNALSANIAALQGKGLNGPALDALLAQGDSATIANFAALSAAQLDQYEQTYQVRADLAASVGAQAAAAAGYTAQIVALQAKVDQTNALLAQLNGIQKDAPKKTGHAVGKAGKRGASQGSRDIKRG